MSNTNSLIQSPGTQLDQPQISSSPPQMNQAQPTLHEQLPQELLLLQEQPVEMNQPTEQVVADQMNTTPSQETTRDNQQASVPSTAAPTQSSASTVNATQLPNHTTSTQPVVNSSPPTQACLREGCCNPTVESHEWDNEYCSSECVVAHCRWAKLHWICFSYLLLYSPSCNQFLFESFV